MLRLQVVWKRSDSRALKSGVREAIGSEMEAIARDCAADAKGRAPVLTGALRDSIETEQESDLHWAVVAGMPYAPFVEFGTRQMAAQPFLTPAAAAAEVNAPRRLATAARRAMEEAAR